MKLKKLILSSFLICTLISCKKDPNEKKCYECDTENPRNGNYTFAGCYTEAQWNQYQITDAFGTPLDKNSRCRKK